MPSEPTSRSDYKALTKDEHEAISALVRASRAAMIHFENIGQKRYADRLDDLLFDIRSDFGDDLDAGWQDG